MRKLLFIFLCMVVSLNAASWQKIGGGASSAPTNGLVAYYQCENNVLDTQGTYNGTASNVTYAAGKSGQACVFNGTSSYVGVPNMGISGAQALSISVWFRGPSLSTDNLRSIFGIGVPSGTRSTISVTIGESGLGTASYTLGNDSRLLLSNLQNGTWYHLVSTYDGATLKAFVNGIEIYSSLASMQVVENNQNSIGSINRTSRYFSGSLDQIRIYNRALSASEVQAIYQAGN